MAKKKKPPPKCKAILLCDQAIVDAFTGKPSIIGIFGGFNAPAFPGQTAPFTAFLQLTDGIGEYQITIEVRDLQEDTIIGRAEAPPMNFPDRTTKLNCFIAVPPLPLTHAGRYDFVVLADGQEIDRQQFQAQIPATPGETLDGNHPEDE
jgi:hypothetical protein